jgi:hypothetical protein
LSKPIPPVANPHQATLKKENRMNTLTPALQGFTDRDILKMGKKKAKRFGKISEVFCILVGQHRPYGIFPYLSVQLRAFTTFKYIPRRGGLFHYRSVLQLPIAGVSFCPFPPYLFTSDKVATS